MVIMALVDNCSVANDALYSYLFVLKDDPRRLMKLLNRLWFSSSVPEKLVTVCSLMSLGQGTVVAIAIVITKGSLTRNIFTSYGGFALRTFTYSGN